MSNTTTLYTAVRLSATSWSAVTGEPEVLDTGNTATLLLVLIEVDARNLLLGEANRDRWEVVGEDGSSPSPEERAAACELVTPIDVADFLVVELGLSRAEADRLAGVA